MFHRYSTFIGLLIMILTVTGFSPPLRADQERRGIPWWGWLLIILVLLVLFIWWWLSRRSAEKTLPLTRTETVAPPRPPSPPAPAPPPRAEPVAPPPVIEPAPPPISEPAPPPISEPAPPPIPAARMADVPPAPPPPPDDLTVIEGIGPKISSLLKEAGILTFAQLATTDVERLRQILADARLTALADPATWPEQARLAAEGSWEALQELQGVLKRGRRV